MTGSDATPILPGFYPDPTICRVGDTYFLANSSFEYRPGVPLHQSTDLVRWQPVGHALTNTTSFPDSSGEGSSGIFAPTLRHHDGQFWLVTTDMRDDSPQQSIQRADHIGGPWTAPVRTTRAHGIDPDLVWHGGACYLTWAGIAEGLRGIVQARIDPYTAELLEEPRRLWSGTGLAFPEGPHIFRHGDWWYLLIAEGGTERGHCVSIARGASPQGPFEGNQANPILTHRSTTHPVQNTGHADLIECADSSWAMVYLGVRPRGTSPGFHVNGRETFLAGVEWVDGWPVIDEAKYDDVPPQDHSFIDSFEHHELDQRWVSPGVFAGTFARQDDDGLRMTSEQRRFLGVRARDASWSASADLVAASGTGALEVRMDLRNTYAVERFGDSVTAVQTLNGHRRTLAHAEVTPGRAARLIVRAEAGSGPGLRSGGPDLVTLGYHDGTAFRELAAIDGRYLSTEVVGGFTGRMVGLSVEHGSVVARRFSYTPEGTGAAGQPLPGAYEPGRVADAAIG